MSFTNTDNLSFVANLSKSIQVQAGEYADGQGANKLANSNPRFMWLLRDVILIPTDKKNKPCHIKDHLLQKVCMHGISVSLFTCVCMYKAQAQVGF